MALRLPTFAFALTAFGSLAETSCFDPVHADAVDALGPEQDGIPTGPTHRPGQPCLTCHGGDGPGSPDFSVAGTIYAKRAASEPRSGTTVVLTDAAKVTRQAEANEVGNFYITAATWTPTFPVFVELRSPGLPNKAMDTPMIANGGCAFCHRGAGDSTHMPGVFMSEQ